MFFAVIYKVFLDYVGAGRGSLDDFSQAGEDIDAALVVGADLGFAGGYFLGETFGEVESEAVYFIFGQPVFDAAVHVVFGELAFVVEVVENAIGMGGVDVEPGVVGSGFSGGGVPVHLRQGAVVGDVIEDGVEDNGYAVLVTEVYKFFEFIGGAVVFVQGIVEVGIVAPAIVAVKFVDGH